MAGEQEPITGWLIIAVLTMIALAGVVIFISRLAIHRITQEKEKLRQSTGTPTQPVAHQCGGAGKGTRTHCGRPAR